MESTSRRKTSTFAQTKVDPLCPQCGEDEVVTFACRHTFVYGAGSSSVELTANLAVQECKACDFQFLDDTAETVKHEVVCKHLGVLNPKEIKRLRKYYGMSRAQFAEVTGLGEATLGRWENGTKIQNIANDRYIRLLLQEPKNMQRLKNLALSSSETRSESVASVVSFRCLEITPSVLDQQESFQLRLAS